MEKRPDSSTKNQGHIERPDPAPKEGQLGQGADHDLSDNTEKGSKPDLDMMAADLQVSESIEFDMELSDLGHKIKALSLDSDDEDEGWLLSGVI